MYGIIDRDYHYIQKAIGPFPEIEEVKLFGGRALGNYKRGSDVDLAVVGKKVSHQTIVGLNEYLNEIYPLPYIFEVRQFL